MSNEHYSYTQRGISITCPADSSNTTTYLPSLTTVTCTSTPGVFSPYREVSLECSRTPKPKLILFSNPELNYLHSILPKLRMAYLDSLVDEHPGLTDQANLGEMAEMLQAVLDQHANAAKLQDRKDVKLVDLFEVLKIRDEEEAVGRMESMMGGSKL